MSFYFLNFSLLFLQVQSRNEVVQTYYILQALSWILIILALMIFFFFVYLFINTIIDKKNKRLTIKKVEQEVHH